MATPTIVLAFIQGATTGGPAPYHVSVKIDIADGGSSTGSGLWVEGFPQWRVVQANGNPITAADRITCTDLFGGATRRLDTDQHAWNCNYLFRSAGTYKIQARYRNRDGDWSAWVSTGTITVAARSGDVLYAASAGDNSDGLSWATAYNDIKDAITAAKTTPDEPTIYVRDCVCSAQVNGAPDDLWIVGDDWENGKPTITGTGGGGQYAILAGGHRTVMEGLSLTSSGSVISYKSHTGTNTESTCLYECDIDDTCRSLMRDVGGSSGAGISAINCTTNTGPSEDEFVFFGAFAGIMLFGCYSRGSVEEHGTRFVEGGEYLSLQYCYLGQPDNKTGFRCYSDGPMYAHGCDILRSITVGNENELDSANGPWLDYVYERCRVTPVEGQSLSYCAYAIGCSRTMFRCCVFDELQVMVIASSDQEYDTADLFFVNCGFKAIGNGINAFTLTASPATTIDRFKVYNCAFTGTIDASRHLWTRSGATGQVFQGNLFNGGASAEIARVDATSYNIADWNATTDAANETNYDGLTLSTTTGEVTATSGGARVGYAAGVVSGPHPFVSFNGYAYQHDAANYPQGPFLASADAEAEPAAPSTQLLRISTASGTLALAVEVE
jgi:hypothetical protein